MHSLDMLGAFATLKVHYSQSGHQQVNVTAYKGVRAYTHMPYICSVHKYSMYICITKVKSNDMRSL